MTTQVIGWFVDSSPAGVVRTAILTTNDFNLALLCFMIAQKREGYFSTCLIQNKGFIPSLALARFPFSSAEVAVFVSTGTCDVVTALAEHTRSATFGTKLVESEKGIIQLWLILA